jgi:hypothetical protein
MEIGHEVTLLIVDFFNIGTLLMLDWSLYGSLSFVAIYEELWDLPESKSAPAQSVFLL